MDREAYISKMNNILDDANTFRPISNDNTIRNEDRVIRKLRDLRKYGFITADEYKAARPVGFQPARIYGLPKIHKANAPFRPILSAVNTFNYGIAKLLVNRVSHMRRSSTIIHNTFSFIDELHSESRNSSKFRMVSFDVNSLFTMVPLRYTIDLILVKLYGDVVCCINTPLITKDKWCKTCQDRDNMEWLLMMTSNSETNFLFNGQAYCQHNGVAMGSPLGPLLADIFMIELETKVMPMLIELGVIYWRRYVDDTFVLIKPGTTITLLLTVLNSFHPNISFTFEEEKQSSLPFLDILIHRTSETGSGFKTTMYRKPTYSRLITKWYSAVPHLYKTSTISNMMYRAIRICSNFFLLHKEFQFIRVAAKQNGYPKNFVEVQIRKMLNRACEKQVETKTLRNPANKESKKTTIMVEIPFVGKPSSILFKQLAKIGQDVSKKYQVQVIPRPQRTIGNFFRNKDSILNELQSHVIYQVQCSNCTANYIGKNNTSRINKAH